MNYRLFNELLEYYQITAKDYDNLTSPIIKELFAVNNHFDHIEEAVELVKETISKDGKIFIYGDFDADGIMGTSILVKMFKMYKCESLVKSYVPNRYKDGYGITLSKAQEFIDDGASLIITVDNGVSAIEPIKLLKDNGVKVIVLDHHQIQEEIPNADYIIHPTYSHFGEIPSSGSFVAFMFSKVFLGKFDDYLATLASISLISDMMPLKGYNRDLLRYCIEAYKDCKYLAIDLLKENEVFDDNSIGMKIAPKINAIGRMIDSNEINNLVTFFTSDDTNEILKYLNWINETNEARKNLSKDVVEGLGVIKDDVHIIALVTEIKEGMLGLVANYLSSKYNKPAIVFALENGGESYKGSCRSPEGFNIVDAFSALKEYLIVFGGHQSAGGCSVKKDRIDDFIQAFDDFAAKYVIKKNDKKIINISLNDINNENYNLICSFSPFGEEWKKPLFKISGIKTSQLRFSKSGEHILTPIGMNAKLTGFNFKKDEMLKKNYINLIGSLRLSVYKGNSNIEFLIVEIEESNI